MAKYERLKKGELKARLENAVKDGVLESIDRWEEYEYAVKAAAYKYKQENRYREEFEDLYQTGIVKLMEIKPLLDGMPLKKARPYLLNSCYYLFLRQGVVEGRVKEDDKEFDERRRDRRLTRRFNARRDRRLKKQHALVLAYLATLPKSRTGTKTTARDVVLKTLECYTTTEIAELYGVKTCRITSYLCGFIKGARKYFAAQGIIADEQTTAG